VLEKLKIAGEVRQVWMIGHAEVDSIQPRSYQ